jgi:hypothetical protein
METHPQTPATPRKVISARGEITDFTDLADVGKPRPPRSWNSQKNLSLSNRMIVVVAGDFHQRGIQCAW